jgi:hypothetical protein
MIGARWSEVAYAYARIVTHLHQQHSVYVTID